MNAVLEAGGPLRAAAAAPPDAARAVHWRQARRVLALRLDNLGDLLMTTPALAALRESLPGAHISLLTSPAAAAASPHLEMVDRTLAFAAPWVKAGESAGERLGDAELTLLRQLRGQAFDAAVIFTVCTQSALPAALLCRMAGIPLRLATARENPYALLSDWVPETDAPLSRARHEVARQLALVACVGMHTQDTRLRLRLRDGDRAEAAQRLAAAGIGAAQPYLLVHPGASAPSRRWAPERFGAAADAVARRSGCAVVFCGAAGEVPLIDAARAAMQRPAASLAGQLTLGGLAAAIEGAAVLLATNSAPAHLAAAVGTPVVVLYALTNPQHTPWRTPHRVLSHDMPCRGCLRSVCPQPGHGCLAGVSAAQAADAVLELIAECRDAHARRA